MPYGYMHVNGQPVPYELTGEVVGGVFIYVANLSADPEVRCIAARPEKAVEALKARVSVSLVAPKPTWSRQHSHNVASA